MACCLANEIIKIHGLVTKFISVPDFLEVVRSKDDNSKIQLDALYKCELLIFDDIGAETDKQEWINNAIFRLIDFRYKNHLSTIYTSNSEIGALKGDDRTINRIEAVSVPVFMPEQSIRTDISNKFTKEFLTSLGI